MRPSVSGSGSTEVISIHALVGDLPEEGVLLMFAHILEITPKLGKKDELINTIRQEILPILKKQPGFLEFLPFHPEVAQEHMIAITL